MPIHYFDDTEANRRAVNEAARLRQQFEDRLNEGVLDSEKVLAWAVIEPMFGGEEQDLLTVPTRQLLEMYPEQRVAEAINALRESELEVISYGRASLDLQTSIENLRYLFGPGLEVGVQPVFRGADHIVFIPYLRFSAEATIPRRFAGLLRQVGLACPPIFAQATPPSVPYNHLRLPDELAQCVNAHSLTERGRGVEVAIIDTGIFLDHEFFDPYRKQINVVLAPGARYPDRDPWGHGTAVAACLLSVAPEVNLTMVKMPMEEQGSGLKVHATQALRSILQNDPPEIIVCAWGFGELDRAIPGDLALEIRSSVATRETVFVCAAGNTRVHMHPSNMLEVIAVGGAWRDGSQIRASDYASSFTSVVTSKRCPDIAGPCGKRSLGIYMMAPTDLVSYYDVQQYNKAAKYPDGDETMPGDGWCGIGGSSMAAAVVGGVAAIVRGIKPSLSAAEVKEILENSAEPVTSGYSADGHRPPTATGAGFINARGSINEVQQHCIRRSFFDRSNTKDEVNRMIQQLKDRRKGR